jgi:hypothetical protein
MEIRERGGAWEGRGEGKDCCGGLGLLKKRRVPSQGTDNAFPPPPSSEKEKRDGEGKTPGSQTPNLLPPTIPAPSLQGLACTAVGGACTCRVALLDMCTQPPPPPPSTKNTTTPTPIRCEPPPQATLFSLHPRACVGNGVLCTRGEARAGGGGEAVVGMEGGGGRGHTETTGIKQERHADRPQCACALKGHTCIGLPSARPHEDRNKGRPAHTHAREGNTIHTLAFKHLRRAATPFVRGAGGLELSLPAFAIRPTDCWAHTWVRGNSTRTPQPRVGFGMLDGAPS